MTASTRRRARCFGLTGLFLPLLFMAMTGSAQAESAWFKVAGGLSGLSMDDINDGTFRFYDTSINGYNFPDLESGFSLSFHLGTDISDDLAFGFSWDIQHAHVKGTDVDVSANLKLDANLLMGHVYWTPVRGRRLSAGLAAGSGMILANGTVKMETTGVNYGEGKVSGSNIAVEVLGTAEYGLGNNKALQLTAGWRLADIRKIKFRGAPARNEDGSDLALGYTGYAFKLGLLWRFGDGPNRDGGDIH